MAEDWSIVFVRDILIFGRRLDYWSYYVLLFINMVVYRYWHILEDF